MRLLFIWVELDAAGLAEQKQRQKDFTKICPKMKILDPLVYFA